MLADYGSREALAVGTTAREEQGTVLIAEVQHPVIGDTRLHLSHVQHRVALLAETVHDLPFDALVSQEYHAAIGS